MEWVHKQLNAWSHSVSTPGEKQNRASAIIKEINMQSINGFMSPLEQAGLRNQKHSMELHKNSKGYGNWLN